MDNIIYIEPYENGNVFTTYCFYNSLLPQIQQHYKESKKAPIFSFDRLNRIEPLVLPNLLGLGYYLSRFHKEPIELLLTYNPKLLYYLHKAEFFNISASPNKLNPSGLSIFNFDDRFIGGFSSYIDIEQRKEHRIHYYIPLNNTDSLDDSHDLLLEDLTLFTLRDHFEKVLLDHISDDSISECIESIAEPISNGILHSKSITWAISQSTPKPFEKTVLSIVDVGIGFKESLKLNNIEDTIITKVKAKGLYKHQFEDFYYIFESLYYSLIKNRSGLVDFIFKVAENGIVRIHYNSTQILFTPRIIKSVTGLKECRKKIMTEQYQRGEVSDQTKEWAANEILNLSQVLLKLFCNDKKYSPIRIYDVIFKGVHIEFELPNTFKS